MKIKYLANIAMIMVIFLCGSSVFAATSYTQFGRYLSVTNTIHGNNPYGMNEIIQRTFPNNIQTIGDAVRYTLNGTGYHLLSAAASTKVVKQLYGYPLPVYLRNIGPIFLNQALLKLSGQTYQLVVDPIHRLVTYKLRNSYQRL